MSDLVVYVPPSTLEVTRAAADLVTSRTDDAIVRLWLAERGKNTYRKYKENAMRFMQFVGKPLNAVTLEDVHAFSASLDALAPSSRKSILSVVKSLFSFASADGIRHLRYNVAAAVRLRKPKETLNERILSEDQVEAIIAAASPGRNRHMLDLLYQSGIRAEEIATLHWRDLRIDGDAYIMTVFGKGEKTRHLRLDQEARAKLDEWRNGATDDAPVFPSRRGGGLSTCQVWRIVHAAAVAVGIHASTHWLRHSHASHATRNGCDVFMLQQSLGHESIETTMRYVHTAPGQSSSAFVGRRRSKLSAGKDAR